MLINGWLARGSSVKRSFLVLAISFLFSSTVYVMPSANASTGVSDSFIDLQSNTGSPTRYAVATASSGFSINSAITIQAWVYPTNNCVSAGFCHIVRKEDGYTIAIADGKFKYALNGASGGWSWSDTLITARLDQWQHVALVRENNASTVTFYFNGRSVYSGTSGAVGSGGLRNSNFNFTLGAMTSDINDINASPIYPFIGGIDEVKIWQVARTQEQINSDMNSYGPVNNSDLKLYYDFNDVSGSTLINRANNAPSSTNLTLRNTPVFASVETTTVSGGNRVVTFPRTFLSANGWKAPVGIDSIRMLVVGGGGGAGFNSGGGGSGGGVIESTISYAGAGLFPIVGNGGIANTGGVFPFNVAANGETSTVSGLIAPGGRSGFNFRDPDYLPASGGAAVNGYGAGGRGATSSASAVSGSNGYSSSITGSATFYGGGGGGGAWSSSRSGGTGGAGGGGAGLLNGNGVSGTKNTGGGGGSNASGSTISGNGGSGIIIFAFNAFFGTANAITTAVFRTTTSLSVTLSEAGRVSFSANGKIIPGCKSRSSVTSSTITATCSWRPSQRGSVSVSARFTPTSSPSSPTTIPIGNVFVTSRSGSR